MNERMSSWRMIFCGEIRRWVDGDTVDVDLRLAWITVHARIRLARVDAPPLGTGDGFKAYQEMQRAFPPGAQCEVRIFDRDRYQRMVGDLWVGDLSACEYLRQIGLG